MGGGIASVGPTPKKVLAEHPVFNSAVIWNSELLIRQLAMYGFDEQLIPIQGKSGCVLR